MYYSSEKIYLDSCTSARAKITAIDNIIDVLMNTVLISVGNADVQEYMLNDGQTVIKTAYRSPEHVVRSVGALNILRTYYINQINNPARRLVDSKNFLTGNNF